MNLETNIEKIFSQLPKAVPFKTPVTIKDIQRFKNRPEIEALYRFIEKNDLRKEAIEILDKHLLN